MLARPACFLSLHGSGMTFTFETVSLHFLICVFCFLLLDKYIYNTSCRVHRPQFPGPAESWWSEESVPGASGLFPAPTRLPPESPDAIWSSFYYSLLWVHKSWRWCDLLYQRTNSKIRCVRCLNYFGGKTHLWGWIWSQWSNIILGRNLPEAL